MKPARFFFLDARAAVPFVFVLLHLRWYTLVIAAITTLIFYVLETRGLNFDAALRAFRVWLVTKKRPNVQHSDRTRMIDYGFEKAVRPERASRAPSSLTIKTVEKTGASSTDKTKKGKANQGANRNANQAPIKKTEKTVRPSGALPRKN